jgi:hypothetical protein
MSWPLPHRCCCVVGDQPAAAAPADHSLLTHVCRPAMVTPSESIAAYSEANQRRTYEACPHATEVRTFNGWLAAGRVVSKGQKGIRLVAPDEMDGGKARSITPVSVPHETPRDAAWIMVLTAVERKGFEDRTRRKARRPEMQEPWFHRVAKQLGERSGSRRRALQVLVAALAGAGLVPAVFPEAAAGGARQRCRRRGGHPVPGPCRCALTCDSTDLVKYGCSSLPDCACRETAEGSGFCGWEAGSKMGCSSSAECDAAAGEQCVINRRCNGSGGRCTTPKDCPTAAHGCVNGTCQIAHCFTPCPV